MATGGNTLTLAMESHFAHQEIWKRKKNKKSRKTGKTLTVLWGQWDQNQNANNSNKMKMWMNLYNSCEDNLYPKYL